MKKIIILLAVFLLILPVLGDLPTKYSNCKIEVKIQESGVMKESIYLTFPENVTKFNYYIIHPVTDLQIFANSKEIECEQGYERAGTLVSCKNFNSNKISMSFNYYGLISPTKDYNVFSDRYIISTPTDNFNLKIFLPKGYILAEQEGEVTQPPYYPVNGIQKTDGRNIYIEWKSTPKLGEVYDVSIFYEQALGSDNFAVIIFTVLIIVAIVSVFIFFKRSQKIKDYGLTEDERKFLNVLSKEKKLSQRKISRKINLSKTQTSRISKSLEKRGLIKRKRKGRNYEIVLK